MPVRRFGGEIIQETFSRDQGLEGQEIPPVEAAPVVPVEAVAPPQASLQPVPQFMDRESRQLQRAETTPTMSPPPAAPAPAPSGPVDRSRYAALFPSDITSGLIRAEDQGIGSLRS